MEFDPSWDALLKPGKATRFFERKPRPRLSAGTSAFTFDNAWWLAELTRLVYRSSDSEPTRSSILRRVGLYERCMFDIGGTNAVLIGSLSRVAGDFGILVFRGTMRFSNWVTNLHALPANWRPGGKVHQGFRRAITRAWKQIEAGLDTVKGPLVYGGHSLGGALATLAASLRPPRAVYTFGSPRVGDAEFADTLAGIEIHRCVNRRDLVPTLPPPGGPLGFCHVGTTHQLVPGRGTSSEPTALELPDLTLPMPKKVNRRMAPPSFLSDHAPVNYVAALELLL